MPFGQCDRKSSVPYWIASHPRQVKTHLSTKIENLVRSAADFSFDQQDTRSAVGSYKSVKVNNVSK
jgi:hypothetical protein